MTVRTTARLLAPLALLAGTLGLSEHPATALPVGGPVGAVCTLAAVTDHLGSPGEHVATMVSGPLVTGTAGRLQCSVHVNNNVHSGPYATPPGRLSCAATGGVAACPSGILTYRATAADDVAVCGEWVPASGPTLYWVDAALAAGQLGHWSTNASSSCGLATSVKPDDPECPVWLTVDKRLGTTLAETWQDCEPYEPIV